MANNEQGTNSSFTELLHKLGSDPLNIQLSKEQAHILTDKLSDTPFCKFFWFFRRHPRIWIQFGGDTPTFRAVLGVPNPHVGQPRAYDITFSLDGRVISGNCPRITNEAPKGQEFKSATNTLLSQKQQHLMIDPKQH